MIIPSLQLNFARTKQLDRRITFSRADTGANQASYYDAQGLLRYARQGEPRFQHDPSTGSSLGLLVEESRQNLLTYSEQFDNAAWTKTSVLAFGSGSVANATTAPDGTSTADKIVEDTSTGFHVCQQSKTLIIGTSYSMSVYAKASERSVIRLYGVASGYWVVFPAAVFDLANGSVYSSSGDKTATITSVGNGWYRCCIYGTSAVATNAGFGVNLAQSTTSVGSYQGDGTSGLYIWGAQLEVGAFPTSYIPTVASAVTRAADSAVMTGANFSSWYRQDEGTFVVVYNNMAANIAGVSRRIAAVSNGSISNRIVVAYGGGGGVPNSFIIVGGVTQADIKTTMAASGLSGFAYKTNDVASAHNGALVGTDTSVTLPAVDRLYIGNPEDGSTTGASTANGCISRISFFPARLTNAELQALSTL